MRDVKPVDHADHPDARGHSEPQHPPASRGDHRLRADPDPDADTDADTDTDTDTDAKPDPDTNPDGDTNADPDGHAERDAGAYAHTVAGSIHDAPTFGGADAVTHPGTRCHSVSRGAGAVR